MSRHKKRTGRNVCFKRSYGPSATRGQIMVRGVKDLAKNVFEFTLIFIFCAAMVSLWIKSEEKEALKMEYMKGIYEAHAVEGGGK